MNEIKSFLLNFLMLGNSISDFEKWLYEQDSIEFEKLITEESYLDLISTNFKNTSVKELKSQLKESIPFDLAEEFKKAFDESHIAITGKCIKKEALNYDGKSIRTWDVEIGKEYSFISITLNKSDKVHSAYVNYADENYDYRPSGYVPMDLFKIDLNNISNLYLKEETENQEIQIEPKEWTERYYKPNNYSFWEDYYDDEEKAMSTYEQTILQLGIKNLW